MRASRFLYPTLTMFSLLLGILAQVSTAQEQQTKNKPAAKADDTAKGDSGWTRVLPESGLEGWEITNFGGEGKVENKDGVLHLERGEPLTGINRLNKDFPTENYEMRWSAQREDGSDFFAGITFPVGKEFCSFICGGWGGGLVGISSINGNDASENETSSYRDFKNGKWYQFRVRVDKLHITVWIDDEQVIQVVREKRRFSVRAEVMRSRPLGYCVFQSQVSVKDWEYRTVE